MMRKIVFLCVENSCRSQIAEAYGKMFAPKNYEVFSAGSSPSGRINPKAASLMKECNYDLSSHSSTSINTLPKDGVDTIVSMGCGDVCPHVPARQRIEWNIPDPKEMSVSEFRKVRDIIGI